MRMRSQVGYVLNPTVAKQILYDVRKMVLLGLPAVIRQCPVLWVERSWRS
jgi:hypothetical protein